VTAAFARAGLKVEVSPEYNRRAVGDLPWVVNVVLLVPIGAFFAKFGSEAGKDAYAAVKDWIRDVWEARRDAGTGTGSIDVSDPDASHLILSSSYPPEALDALCDIDWSEKRGDYLVWDHERRVWRDPTTPEHRGGLNFLGRERRHGGSRPRVRVEGRTGFNEAHRGRWLGEVG
jgi:hypothetical protein